MGMVFCSNRPILPTLQERRGGGAHACFPLTRPHGQVDSVIRHVVALADRAHMCAVVLRLDLLDGEQDAAGAVGEAVAPGAVLEGLVLDVMTQQPSPRGAPPLYGQLGDFPVVLVAVRARHGDGSARKSEELGDAVYRWECYDH